MMELSSGPSISFGGGLTPFPALAKIDDTHYLCAYEGETGSDHGAAVVLTVIVCFCGIGSEQEVSEQEVLQ